MNMRENSIGERGSVFFFILLGIALFVALGFAVTSMTRSPSGQMKNGSSNEAMMLALTDIQAVVVYIIWMAERSETKTASISVNASIIASLLLPFFICPDGDLVIDVTAKPKATNRAIPNKIKKKTDPRSPMLFSLIFILFLFMDTYFIKYAMDAQEQPKPPLSQLLQVSGARGKCVQYLRMTHQIPWRL